MTGQLEHSHTYDLTSVLVHAGHSVHAGHYYCYVKAPNNVWHRMDDESVSAAKLSTVLKQQAYILMYTRRDPIVPTRPVLSPKSAEPKLVDPTRGPSAQDGRPKPEPKSNPAKQVAPTKPKGGLENIVLEAVASAAPDSDDENVMQIDESLRHGDQSPRTTDSLPKKLMPPPMSPVMSPPLERALAQSKAIARTVFASECVWRVDTKICGLSGAPCTLKAVVGPNMVEAAGSDLSDEGFPDDEVSEVGSLETNSDNDIGGKDVDEDDASESDSREAVDDAGSDRANGSKRKRRSVQVIEWDQASGDRKGGTPFQWDGKRRKTDDVLEFLQTDRTLGHQVHQWSGAANAVDAAVVSDEVGVVSHSISYH